MRFLALASVVALSPVVARAEVGGEVSAGAGVDTAAPGGFATAHASLTAELSRTAPTVTSRGLFIGGDDGSGYGVGGLWLFTGLEREDRDGLGGTADATIRARPGEDALLLSARGWARFAGWQLAAHTEVQPVGGLRDRFWRSGRGVTATGTAIDVPAMWAIGTEHLQLLAALETIELGKRYDHGASAGFDEDFAFTGVRIQTDHTTVDVFDVDWFELGVPRQTIGDTTYGTAVSGIDVDLARIRMHRGDLELSARGGVAMRSPIGPYSATGTTETFSGPAGDAFTYGLDARAHGISISGGSWIRIDPSGHAVDSGQLGSVSIERSYRLGRFHAGLDLGRLRRIALGLYAPADLMPVGTRMWMARASIDATMRVTPHVEVIASSWLERSDRDDPRWLVPSTGELSTHAGTDLTAQWRFDPLRPRR